MIRFAGYAAVFGRVDRGGDVIRAGAIRVPDAVPLLWQHRGPPIGRVERAAADDMGLQVVGAIDDPRLAALVEAKAIDGLSFGYRVRTATRGRIREITDLDLVEISLVARPMQPLARIHAVSPSPLVGEGGGPSRRLGKDEGDGPTSAAFATPPNLPALRASLPLPQAERDLYGEDE